MQGIFTVAIFHLTIVLTFDIATEAKANSTNNAFKVVST